jgi:hypothetical protein
MLEKIEIVLTFFELRVLHPLFIRTSIRTWIPIIHDTIVYGLIGLILGAGAHWLFDLPMVALLYGLLGGVGYELLKELWLMFMRPSAAELSAIHRGECKGKYLIFRSLRWGHHVSLLCTVRRDGALEVIHIYRQGWHRHCYKGMIIAVYSPRELLLAWR